jgi:hypothetical protein
MCQYTFYSGKPLAQSEKQITRRTRLIFIEQYYCYIDTYMQCHANIKFYFTRLSNVIKCVKERQCQ